MNIPSTTYRIQFSSSFQFKDAIAITEYLKDLGIGAVYSSPILEARPGSRHGYDVINPFKINPELGDGEDLNKLVKQLYERGIGWLQDIVPNHMAFDSQNKLLMDIFENGPNSKFSKYFDIDWDYHHESIRGKLLTPFLGKFYGEALENGEIKLVYENKTLKVAYYDWRFPLKIETYFQFFSYNLARLKDNLGKDNQELIKFLGAVYALKNLPKEGRTEERYGQISFAKNILAEIYSRNESIREFIDSNIKEFNGKPGKPQSFNLLDDLLSRQWFRLSFWKVANEEINYRRFFNINELISLKEEDEEVFDSTHGFILKVYKENKFWGLRVDHIDGLFDPHNYLKRIRSRLKDAYIIVEKILVGDETLPADWPVQGTTGYDFLNVLNGVFCEKRNARRFQSIYAKFSRLHMDSEELLVLKKRLIIGKNMAGEVDNLAYFIKQISSRDRQGSDITLYGLKRALVEVLAIFPVYRTYVTESTFRPSDKRLINWVIEKAIKRIPDFVNELRFIRKFLLLDYSDYSGKEDKKQWLHFVMRFQQFTGPLIAKGFEDTTLYVYNRFISLNEVGSALSDFGKSIQEFHRFNKRRLAGWPHTMNTTSTHDTKRGEDARARLNVISEIPQEWENNLKLWARANKKKKKNVKGIMFPDSNDEYFLYQTLAAHLPLSGKVTDPFKERLKSYLIKAVREAKVHTAWLRPDTEYEEAYIEFCEKILSCPQEDPFMKSFLDFQEKIAYFGVFNSLSQLVLKSASPGVADFYQGSEFWNLSFVDPDNRRAIDFKKRIKALAYLKNGFRSNKKSFFKELFASKEDGRIKMFLTYQLIQARALNKDLFLRGKYAALKTEGKFKHNIIAFARKYRDNWCLAIVPRFFTSLIEVPDLPVGRVWSDTSVNLPFSKSGQFRDMITGSKSKLKNKVYVRDVINDFPSALLINT